LGRCGNEGKMCKLMLTIKKKKGMSRQAFIDYYENQHAVLCRKSLPPLEVYRRNYVTNTDPFLKAIGDNRSPEGENDFDVITEAIYTSRKEAETSMAALFNGNTREQIMNDEANFCEPADIKFYVVEVHQSSIPW
jgi:hypothetical protein